VRVEDIMSTDVLAVSPQTPLQRVAELLVRRNVSGLPVIEADGQVVGVVSQSDILQKEREPRSDSGLVGRLWRRRRDVEAKCEARTAGEAMTSPPVTAHPSMRVSQAATLMLERGVDQLVVVKGWSLDRVAKDTTLAGIVTRGDCVRAFARADKVIGAEIREIVTKHGLSSREVAVGVNRGEVVLDGELERRSEAEGLADAAARVPGVVSVYSMLTWRVTDIG
jgi:CBS domain-containing protein